MCVCLCFGLFFTCTELGWLNFEGFCFQIDRLQVNLQERDLMSGQSETMLKSKLTDKDEEVTRLRAEINILHEKLSQTQAQVCMKIHGDVCDIIIINIHLTCCFLYPNKTLRGCKDEVLCSHRSKPVV